MFTVVLTTPLGHKYWMKAQDGLTITYEWVGLKNNGTVFGPQQDAIEHRAFAKRKEPYSKITIENA